MLTFLKSIHPISSVLVVLLLSAIRTPADEIGLATGLNTSFLRWEHQARTDFQKNNFFNPVEISYQKTFNPFIGLLLSLRYSKRSIEYSAAEGNLTENGDLDVEETLITIEKNFASVEICPVLYKRSRNFIIEARMGLSVDLYCYDRGQESGYAPVIDYYENSSPLVLSYTGGVGIGYIINDRFIIGIRSGLSRTLTDVWKNQSEDFKIHFLNLYNVVRVGVFF